LPPTTWAGRLDNDDDEEATQPEQVVRQRPEMTDASTARLLLGSCPDSLGRVVRRRPETDAVESLARRAGRPGPGDVAVDNERIPLLGERTQYRSARISARALRQPLLEATTLDSWAGAIAEMTRNARPDQDNLILVFDTAPATWR
jgi:hypothetical protein